MRLTQSLAFLTLIFGILSSTFLNANNGAIAYIYPISNIEIDGKLDDWPAEMEIYKMQTVHYGDGLDGPEDGLASWRGGYDAASGHLYIAVTMTDDDYVKTPDDSHFTTHDFQVLYLDPLHSPEGGGVIAYEVDEHHRKIVEQEGLSFYPQVKDASFEQVELAIERVGNIVTYEWKIEIASPLKAGRMIGFDYGVFDKDTDQDHVMITWGSPGGEKFMNSNLIGDIVLLESNQAISSVEGTLEWQGEAGNDWPWTVRFSDTNNPNTFTNASIDSLGRYSLKLPPGTYKVTIPPSWRSGSWFEMDRIESTGDIPNLTVADGQTIKMDAIGVAVAAKPDLVPEKGILHSPFTTASHEQVNAFVEAYQAYYNIPAVSLALIQDGKLVFHNTYGVENSIAKTPLRDEAVFEAASITKLVFAYSMNRLVQRGEFDLDKPLAESLAFPDLEEYPEYRMITGKHVLTHVTGLPNWGRRMINTPGTTYGYSGEGFEYLKRTLAGGGGDEMPGIIQAHMEKEVLEPLGMTNTYFMCNDKLTDLKVAGHFYGTPNMFDCPDEPGMAWSMHTEAKDFASFALALMNREGLTKERAEDMFTFHTVGDEEDWINGYKTGFGLGVALRDSPYGLVFGHGGNNGDFRCTFEMYDELKSGYIMFTNSNTAEPLLYALKDFLVEGR
ncbi:MAG: serine hydrolase [Bacteroidota bacterium]